jgi:hypothetical protein
MFAVKRFIAASPKRCVRCVKQPRLGLVKLFDMRTRFLILFLLFAINASAQTHRIDSLKKMLPGLGDRTRVNCLNALGWEFDYWFVHSDSALKYAKLAWQYASDISYNSGKAVSLIIQGDVQGRLLGDQAEKERYGRPLSF